MRVWRDRISLHTIEPHCVCAFTGDVILPNPFAFSAISSRIGNRDIAAICSICLLYTSSHRAVISNIGKGIGAAGRIVKEHRIGAQCALTTKGQRAENQGRYTRIDFVVEDLARARADAESDRLRAKVRPLIYGCLLYTSRCV